MVRVNLFEPKKLSDQHLIAEYNEIRMIIEGFRKFPNIKEKIGNYRLGKGHMNFFKNKLIYLKRRHNKIRKEMQKRGFQTNYKIDIKDFSWRQKRNWIVKKRDLKIIRERIILRIIKRPNWYRYYGKYKEPSFFINMLKI